VGDSNKPTNNHSDDEHVENILDSDELFDLDMPLDEPDIDLDMPLDKPDIDLEDDLSKIDSDMSARSNEETQTIAPENESSDISNSLQGLIDEFPNSVAQNSATNQPQEEQETQFTVEQDIEHLLDHRSVPDADEFLQAAQPTPADAINMEDNTANMNTSTLAETDPMEEIPVSEKTKPKPRFGIANSVMITLGLIAILIVVLAGWLGLDISQQKSDIASLSTRLQQQTTLLEQQQKQQNSLLTKHIDILEKRLNTLTQVIANKTTEQWRASLQQPLTQPEKTAPVPLKKNKMQAAQATKSNASATPESALKADKKVARNNAPKKKKPVVTPATAIKTPAIVKSVAKHSTAVTPLSMYEVAPGTVKGWVVNIYSVTSKSAAERRIRQLKNKNIDATYVRVQIKGKIWYRVRSTSFKDKRAASIFKKFLKEYQGIDAWYSHLK